MPTRTAGTELIVVSYGQLPQWLYLLTPWVDFAAIGLPEWIRWAGATLTVVGLAVFIWTHAELAGNWSPLVQPARAGTLVTGGPYRWVRHPMYTAFFIYNTGLLLLTSNWIAGVPPLVTFAWMYFHRVGREERVMLEQFGDEYRAYAEKTGRVVPGVGRKVVG